MESVKSRSVVRDSIGSDVVAGSVFGVGAFCVGCLGVWSVSCFISGVLASGGVISFVKNWCIAVGVF